jgi:hypothetical protein
MAILNLATRNYRLIIGGLDCSAGVIQGSVSQSQYQSQQGLIATQGSFTLRNTTGFTEDLDDRTNPQWRRTASVTLEIADTTGTLRPAPIGAQTYINEAEYDGRQTLSIKTTCIIGLLDAATPPGPGLDVDPGDTLNASAILSQISNRLGGVSITGSLQFASWQAPTSKTDNRSYVKFLGAVCWANGAIAYSNSTAITIKPINLYPAPLMTRWVERDAQDFNRLTGAERPCEVVRVTGIKLEVEPTPPDDVTTNTTPGVVSDIVPRTVGTSGGDEPIIVSITETTSNRNNSTRIETETTEVQRAAGTIDPRLDVETSSIGALCRLVDAETTISTRTFETPPYVLGAPPGKTPTDEGRLLEERSTTTTKGDYALKAWNDNLPEQLQKFDSGNVTQSETVTKYTYRFLNKEAGDRVIQGEYVQFSKITETRQIRAVAFPSVYFSPFTKAIPYEIQLGPNTVQKGTRWARSQDPLEEIVTERVIVEYAENAAGEWVETTTPYSATVDEIDADVYYDEAGIGEIFYSSPPDPMPDWLQVTTLTHGNIRLAPGTIRRRTGPSVQPPSPTRFSKEIKTTEKPITGEVKLAPLVGGNLQDRERDYQAEPGTLTQKSQAEKVAKTEGAILLGRHKGGAFSLDCADPLFSYSPLCAVDWVQPDLKIQRYLIDGLSLGMSDRQLVAAADGIWTGTVGTADPNNPPVANPTPPDPTVTVETPPPTLPYRPVYRFTFAMAKRTAFTFLPYPTTRTFTFTSKMGHFFGGLSRIGDAPLVTVGSESAEDPIVRAEGDAPVATLGTDSASAPPLPSGDAPVATVGSESVADPSADGDAPIATLGTDSAGDPTADGDAPIATLGTEGAS